MVVVDETNGVELMLTSEVVMVGDVIVGMVRCKKKKMDDHRLQLYIAGRCRINDRWHSDHYSMEEDQRDHPYHSSLPTLANGKSMEQFILHHGSSHHHHYHGCCIWSTNVLDLHSTPPTHIHMSSVATTPSFTQSISTDTAATNDATPNESQSQSDLIYHPDPPVEPHQDEDDKNTDATLLFVFHCRLPLDLPPTVTTVTTKYSYSAVLIVQQHDNTLSIQQAPFTVMTTNSSNSSNNNNNSNSNNSSPTMGGGRIKVGTCHLVSHFHPRHFLSPTQQHLSPASRPLTSNSQQSSSPSSSSLLPTPMAIKTMQGQLCGAICLLSNPNQLMPGQTFLLQLDFASAVVPSYKLHLSLEQMEYLLHHHQLQQQPQPQRQRRLVQRTILDSHDQLLTPATILQQQQQQQQQQITIPLRLPLDTLPTFQTDLVQMAVTCKIQLTISSSNNHTQQQQEKKKYQLLSMEIPCYVQSSLSYKYRTPNQQPIHPDDNDVDTFDWKHYHKHKHKQQQQLNNNSDDESLLSSDDIKQELGNLSFYILNNKTSIQSP